MRIQIAKPEPGITAFILRVSVHVYINHKKWASGATAPLADVGRGMLASENR